MALPKSLADGYGRFLAGQRARDAARYEELATHGQSPVALVIACCDSRVEPQAIFDSGPGELFVMRNVANLVPPYESEGHFHGTSAAVEFAVDGLEVPHIIVLGHSSCGGIKAYRAGATSGGAQAGRFIGPWMSILEAGNAPAPDTSGSQLTVEQHGVRISLANLRTFPGIAAREAAGTLHLHGSHYDIATGALSVLDPDTGRFENVTDA